MIIYKRFLAKLFVNRLDHAVFGACVYLFLTFHLTKRVIVYFYSKLNRILLTTHVKSQHTCCYNLLTGLNNVLLVSMNKVELVNMNNVELASMNNVELANMNNVELVNMNNVELVSMNNVLVNMNNVELASMNNVELGQHEQR